jgi:hypothetical protein
MTQLVIVWQWKACWHVRCHFLPFASFLLCRSMVMFLFPLLYLFDSCLPYVSLMVCTGLNHSRLLYTYAVPLHGHERCCSTATFLIPSFIFLCLVSTLLILLAFLTFTVRFTVLLSNKWLWCSCGYDYFCGIQMLRC